MNESDLDTTPVSEIGLPEELEAHSVRSQRLCPACDYPLVGLPDEHRCPECGFAYAPDILVFRKKPTWRRLLLVLYSILAIVAAGVWFRGQRSLAVILGINALIGYTIHGRALGARLIVGLAEIRHQESTKPARVFPFESVTRVTNGILDGSIALFDRYGARTAMFKAKIVGRRRRNKLLAAEIKRRVERARSTKNTEAGAAARSTLASALESDDR